MSFDLKTNKVKVDKVLVADDNAGLAVTGTNVTALTTDGQLGLYNQYTNLANTAPAFSTDPAIYIAQGQSTTSHSYPLTARPQERSMPIDGQYVYRVKKATYAAPTNNVWIIGAPDGATGEINVADQTLYELTIKFDGRRVDILNGRNQPAIFPQFETPDYSTDGPATEVLQRDDLVMNLVHEINMQSRLVRPSGSQLVAFAVHNVSALADPGSVQKTIADLDDGTDTFTVGYKSDGSRITVTTTAAMSAGVAAAITAYNAAYAEDIATTDLIVPALIATPPAGSAAETDVTAGDTAVAGTSYNCNWIILVALDDEQAYFDRIPQTKVSFDVGLRQGFNTATVTNYEGNKAFEGTGVGRHWSLEYDSSDALRKYDTSQLPGAYSIQYPNPVDSTATYDSYTITHAQPGVTTQGTTTLYPYETMVLIESGDTVTSAAFEAALDGWLQSLPVTPPYNFASGVDLI